MLKVCTPFKRCKKTIFSKIFIDLTSGTTKNFTLLQSLIMDFLLKAQNCDFKFENNVVYSGTLITQLQY